MEPEKKSSHQLKKTTLFSGKWLRLCAIDYTIGSKTIKNYESMERTTRKEKDEIDGVSIIGIIRFASTKKKQVILIAQFRPPQDSFVLEFPAGLLETKDPSADAKRELEEETGFHSSGVITSCKLFFSSLEANNCKGRALFYA